MEFRTQFQPLPGSFELFTKPSMTEPDNTMSIPEIIARYTRGQGLAVNSHPWQTGIASEEGEPSPSDATLSDVLGLQSPAAPAAAQEPAAAPAAAQAPAATAAEPSSQAPQPAPAAPAAAPAGA